MKPVKLSNDTHIPPIAYGMWKIKNRREAVEGVKTALAAGYRHFDTAQAYGNEAFLGEALASSSIPRSDLFITTKIANDNQWWDPLKSSFEESLKSLQTGYVDLLLLHFPVTETRRPAWRRMEEIYESGRAKAVGVSNYTVRHLEELLGECTVKPMVNQVELHVYLQQPELVAFCRNHGILVEAYSPLAHGEGISNPVLKEIGQKHGKTPAQIMLRWCVETGAVPLPKSVHEARIQENFDIFDFSLGAEDMKRLTALERNLRTCWDPTNVA